MDVEYGIIYFNLTILAISHNPFVKAILKSNINSTHFEAAPKTYTCMPNPVLFSKLNRSLPHSFLSLRVHWSLQGAQSLETATSEQGFGAQGLLQRLLHETPGATQTRCS